MKITGTHRISAPRQRVWDALLDPQVLVRTLPGCESLEELGPASYEATLSIGVAAIKGSYRGTVELADLRPPTSYRMRATGAGTPGTVDAQVSVGLEPDGEDATVVTFEADAAVGGVIGGVGQRMLGAVAKRTAAEFFRAVERELVGGGATAAADAVASVTPITSRSTVPEHPGPATDAAPGSEQEAQQGVERAEVQLGRMFRATASRPAGGEPGPRGAELVGAVVTGGLLALAGVLVGRRLGGRGTRR